MSPGRRYRGKLAEFRFNYRLKRIVKMCHVPVVEYHQRAVKGIKIGLDAAEEQAACSFA